MLQLACKNTHSVLYDKICVKCDLQTATAKMYTFCWYSIYFQVIDFLQKRLLMLACIIRIAAGKNLILQNFSKLKISCCNKT